MSFNGLVVSYVPANFEKLYFRVNIYLKKFIYTK